MDVLVNTFQYSQVKCSHCFPNLTTRMCLFKEIKSFKAYVCFKIELIYIVVQVQASEQLFPFLKFGWNLDFFQNSCMVTYLVSILVCCQNLGLIPIKLSICIKVLHTCVLNSRNVAFPAGWWRWRARVPAFIIDNVSSTNAMATGNCEPTKPDPERAEC